MTLTSHPAPHKADATELRNGDRMSRAQFHEAYKRTAEDFRAELIGGIVYVASPLSRKHGIPHVSIGAALVMYRAHSPGTECSDNTTVLLGEEAEPQPDLYLRILPEFGGQSGNSDDDYVEGAPELIVEIAYSSRAIDLHLKRKDYRENGVLEYVVVCVEEQKIRHFDLRKNREVKPEADKIVRSFTFAGLWLDANSLFKKDDAGLLAAVQRGIATPEHAAFVAKLGRRREL